MCIWCWGAKKPIPEWLVIDPRNADCVQSTYAQLSYHLSYQPNSNSTLFFLVRSFCLFLFFWAYIDFMNIKQITHYLEVTPRL